MLLLLYMYYILVDILVDMLVGIELGNRIEEQTAPGIC